MQKWTQDEEMEFEFAHDTISNMMSILSGEIAEESAKAQPDVQRLEVLEAEFSQIAKERRDLHLGNHTEFARIHAEYGPRIRAWMTDGKAVNV